MRRQVYASRPGLSPAAYAFFNPAIVSHGARVKVPDQPGMLRTQATRCTASVYDRRIQRRLASILSQIIAATSGPPSAFTARMPVGDVTLISVR